MSRGSGGGGDASASPDLPDPTQRTLYDRMTNPTAQEQNVNARLQALSRSELDKIMTHFGMTLEHLAAQRNDLKVRRSRDATGWTVRLEMVAVAPSPVTVPGSPDA